MASTSAQSSLAGSVWALARNQHGVVTRAQLRELGLSGPAIKHRLSRGRLHRVRRGVYAVGRPELSQLGQYMAAVLSCGPEAVLSHSSAAVLCQVRRHQVGLIGVSVPAKLNGRQHGLVVHRRLRLGATDITARHGIPVTSPVRTLVDLAAQLPGEQLEAAVNEADKRDLIDPERLRSVLDRLEKQPGVGVLRSLLDDRTVVLTDSELERRFLRLVARAGLPRPQAGSYVNGFKVDFYWPELGLVVETDGLRYHRTPAQQARDRRRDQAHTRAGLTALRFTHAQVRFEPEYVVTTLAAVVYRLRMAG